MKALSLKLRDDVFRDVEIVVKAIHVPRNAYINDALVLFNKAYKRKLLKKRLRRESAAVRLTSLEVLRELERLKENLAE